MEEAAQAASSVVKNHGNFMTHIELPEIESHCLSHIGTVREDNQD